MEKQAMLVLSRKKGESIVISDDVVITVIDIRGDKVRIGVEAPLEVPVHRREVFDIIRQSMNQPAIEPVRPAGLTLAGRHIRLIDRLREALRGRSGMDLTRQEVLDAVLDGIEQCEQALREADSQEDLISLLSDKIDGRPGLFHWLSRSR
jgi:carbon storage regulator